MDFIKRYYEKLLLGLVLIIFLVGAVLFYSLRLNRLESIQEHVKAIETANPNTVLGGAIIDPENSELLVVLKGTPKEIVEQTMLMSLVDKDGNGMTEPPPYIICSNPECGKAFAFDLDECPFCKAKQRDKPPVTQEGQDTDKDGLPDEYEREHQMNPNDPADAQLDGDADGFSNIEEYEYGSDMALANDRPPLVELLRVQKVNPVYQPFVLRKISKSFTEPDNKEKWTAKVDFYSRDPLVTALAGGNSVIYPEMAAAKPQISLKLGDVINASLKGYPKYPGGEFTIRGMEDKGKKTVEVVSGTKKKEKQIDDLEMTLVDKAGKSWAFPVDTLVPTGKVAVSFIYLSNRYDQNRCAKIDFIREGDTLTTIRLPPAGAGAGPGGGMMGGGMPGGRGGRMRMQPLDPAAGGGAMPEPTAGMDGGEAGMPGQEEYVLSKIEKISDSEYRVSLMRKRAEINEKPIEIRLFDAKRDILPKPKTPDGRGAPGGNPAMPMRMPSRG